MKNSVYFLVCFILSSVVIVIIQAISCNDNLEKELLMMKGNEFYIPLNQMLCMNDSCPKYSKKSEEKYKMIIFGDSSECSSCYIGNLSRWNDYIGKESVKHLQFLFILTPKKEDVGYLIRKVNFERLRHPVYIDTAGVFSKINPQIPPNPLLHIFLLNENNQVVLAGDPTKNRKIRRMVEEITLKKDNIGFMR